jgi:hypothetical protein
MSLFPTKICNNTHYINLLCENSFKDILLLEYFVENIADLIVIAYIKFHLQLSGLE